MLLVPSGYNEGLATQDDMFRLHQETLLVATMHGTLVPPHSPEGERDGLMAAATGAQREVRIADDALRDFASKAESTRMLEAIDDLELVGALGLIAIDPYHDTTSNRAMPVATQYEIPHSPSAYYTKTTYVLAGGYTSRMQDTATRVQRQPTGRHDPRYIHRTQAAKTHGYDRLGESHRRALWTIVNTIKHHAKIARQP
jgi:hypothetical protein